MATAHTKTVYDNTLGGYKDMNNHFIQVYKDNIDLLIEIGSSNKMALNIFLWLSKHMDNRNALIVSQKALAEVFNVSTRTIINSINYLKKMKALTILKSGNSNIYALNSEIVWQKSDEEKQYAHFTAKVYITKTEQDDYKQLNIAHAVKKVSRRPKKVKKDASKAISEFEKDK